MSAFSAIRRGSRKPGKQLPLRSRGDAQLDGPGPRLPVPLAIAVTLDQPGSALLAVAGAGQRPDLDLHQPLGGKRDHIAQNIGVRGLLHERARVSSSLRSSVGSLVMSWSSQPDPNRESPVTAARPLPRYSAPEGRARSRPCSRQLHHYPAPRPTRSVDRCQLSAKSSMSIFQPDSRSGIWRYFLSKLAS